MLPTVDVGRWHMMGAVTAMMIVLGAVAYNLEGGLFTIFGHWSPRMDALHMRVE